MFNLPSDLENSSVWRTTLARRVEDPHPDERERLRSAFLKFRENALHLASEIRRDIPSLTLHDVTHLDALWDVASTIVGEAYLLTPTEGFVLGGAILLHDLALSVAATEGGFSALVKDPRWADILSLHYRVNLGRLPTSREQENPDVTILPTALFDFLRQVHAERAGKLAFLSFPSTDGTPLYLVEDSELRQDFGAVLGSIAQSHWWSLDEVEKRFGRVLGPPSWCPRDWSVDPLKLACILRNADAAHLDSRRAPAFLKAFTALAPLAEAHWRFQERLARPYLRDDALVFTSSQPFSLRDAPVWWLCLETLRAVDRELRGVDTLFSERGYPRFAARHVAGVDHPERLATYVQTAGWLPINATIHVSDLAEVVKRLGGEALYGANPHVPLRELIQNGCDAIRARRAFEGRPSNFGSVTIALTEPDGESAWLEVEDTGVGMSKRVLMEFLLDFGRSFWASPQMQEEFPGLLASDFRSTGRYGIGFFSVFMLADHVQVLTRRPDAAAADTLVLEFSSGLQGRPILRLADRRERLLDGGTRVRLRLRTDPRAPGGLLHDDLSELSLLSVVRGVAPASDVDLSVRGGSSTTTVVSAGGWQTVPGAELLGELGLWEVAGGDRPVLARDEVGALRARAGENLRLLRDAAGTVFGRACITTGNAGRPRIADFSGVLSIGGLSACRLDGIAGLLVGEPTRATRYAGWPSVPMDVLKRWADEQAALIPRLWAHPDEQAACAHYVRQCGGHTGSLPIARNRGNWISADWLTVNGARLEVAIVVDEYMVEAKREGRGTLLLDENVFVTPFLTLSILEDEDGWPPWPISILVSAEGARERDFSLIGALAEALAESWGMDPSILLRYLDEEEGGGREVRIGTDGGGDVFVHGYRFVRPMGSDRSA